MHLWWGGGGGVEEQMHNVDYVPGPLLETNIKFASDGDRTRVTGGHSTLRAIKTAYTSVADPGCFS